MDTKRGKEITTVILVMIVYSLIVLVIWKFLQPYLTKDFFSRLLPGSKVLGPLVMTGIQALQVLIAPIPVQPVSIASGYLFGALVGFIVAYSGLVLGSFLAFYLGRRFGRPFIKKIVSKKVMDKYDGYAQKVSVFILTLIFWLPFFPDDEIFYILGGSKVKLKKIALPLIIGKTGGASTAIIGAGLEKYSQYTIHLIIVLIIITVLFIYYRQSLEKCFQKAVKKLSAK